MKNITNNFFQYKNAKIKKLFGGFKENGINTI